MIDQMTADGFVASGENLHVRRKIISKEIVKDMVCSTARVFWTPVDEKWHDTEGKTPRDGNTSISSTRYLNLKQVRKIQYQIYACYFVHVLYRNLLHTLGQRRSICFTKCKRVFTVSSLELHGIKKSILCTYQVQVR